MFKGETIVKDTEINIQITAVPPSCTVIPHVELLMPVFKDCSDNE